MLVTNYSGNNIIVGLQSIFYALQLWRVYGTIVVCLSAIRL